MSNTELVIPGSGDTEGNTNDSGPAGTDVMTDPDVTGVGNVETFHLYVNGESVWTAPADNVQTISLRTSAGEVGGIRIADTPVPYVDVLVNVVTPGDDNDSRDRILAEAARNREERAVEVADQVAENRTVTKAEKDREKRAEEEANDSDNNRTAGDIAGTTGSTSSSLV